MRRRKRGGRRDNKRSESVLYTTATATYSVHCLLSMDACMYVHAHTHIHTHKHAHTHTPTHTHINTNKNFGSVS